MNIERDIHPLTDFRVKIPHLPRLSSSGTGQPVVLTINGKAELVVQDAAASDQRLADLAERLETIQAVKESLASIDRGEGTVDGRRIRRAGEAGLGSPRPDLELPRRRSSPVPSESCSSRRPVPSRPQSSTRSPSGGYGAPRQRPTHSRPARTAVRSIPIRWFTAKRCVCLLYGKRQGVHRVLFTIRDFTQSTS